MAELTLTPRTNNHQRILSARGPEVRDIKGTTKSIDRMKKGR